MKITTIRKNNYKWWKFWTWGKVPFIHLEENEFMAVKDNVDFSGFNGCIQIDGTLFVYSEYKRSKLSLLESVEKYLFPKMKVKSKAQKKKEIYNRLIYYLPADTARTACKQIMEIL